MTMNKHWYFLALIVPFALCGCGADDSALPGAKPYVKPPVITPRPPREKKETLKYAYAGEKFRDPFVALMSETTQTNANSAAAPSLGALTLKGIFDDGRQMVAMISGNGSTYFLRDKRLYDNRQRMIRGYTGIIRTDSVLMIAPDRTTKELKLREK